MQDLVVIACAALAVAAYICAHVHRHCADDDAPGRVPPVQQPLPELPPVPPGSFVVVIGPDGTHGHLGKKETACQDDRP